MQSVAAKQDIRFWKSDVHEAFRNGGSGLPPESPVRGLCCATRDMEYVSYLQMRTEARTVNSLTAGRRSAL